MVAGPRYAALIASLPASVPFVGPEVQERRQGGSFRARLGANESIFGPSPAVREAITRAAADVWMYGDSEALALRSAIAEQTGTTLDNIVLGEGIDGLLGTLVRLLIDPGDPVVTSLGAYPTFGYHVRAAGGVLHNVPYRADREDLTALCAKAWETRTKLVYLSNPDNPMGSWHDGAAILAMLDRLPPDCLLLLDEAYLDLAPDGTSPDVAADDPRLIRMRTFSKAHGLAGLRIGYALAAPDLIRAFDKIRNHFGVGRLVQAAALAALTDTDWLAHVRSETQIARARLGQIADENGFVALPSATNFVTMDCGRDGDFARKVLAEVMQQGVFIRMPAVAPLDRCIRVSVGPKADLDIFAAALKDALARL
ncbi:pyridoxal phosphate-dependent aminotransferase [Pseudoruegeria sp. SK021]|uniref:pyridoxal phosphate-dependent aminotransferase n=1 Tax=Pseudoruegeria sp. SK021 TaxID=1933035 RepID=UPI000A228916|nr:pyridoxal phosphate-dependent aminotransferase [Pseudoruegeria sp. SK021]OSP56177.1 histidinol-phosphate aminotransferase [Pseudoruegeria sp. SK021]